MNKEKNFSVNFNFDFDVNHSPHKSDDIFNIVDLYDIIKEAGYHISVFETDIENSEKKYDIIFSEK